MCRDLIIIDKMHSTIARVHVSSTFFAVAIRSSNKQFVFGGKCVCVHSVLCATIIVINQMRLNSMR